MTTPALCAHCRGPVRGRSPVGSPLCRRALSVAGSGPECAVPVEEWGHPAPLCRRALSVAGPEDGVPGLVWLAALYGWTWDAPEMVEAVTW